MKPKASTYYVESDIASIIEQYISSLETPERARFKALQSTPNTVVVKVGKQTFIISVTDKLNAN
jgi:hypothetical protein